MCDCSPNNPEANSDKVYTIRDYLQGISPLLGEDALRVIFVKRHISPATPTEDLSEKELDLAEAEAYFLLSNQPIGSSSTKDVDGSWSHTASNQVSSANIADWYGKYVALREKWGESIIRKSKFRIINF